MEKCDVKKMTYHVTCNTDDNYAQHCCAMLCSLFENNKGYVFHVHVLTHNLSHDNTEQIKGLATRYDSYCTIYEVDESRLEGVKFRTERPLTKAAYYRILLPEILDEKIEKVLYLDCDMIVSGTVEELYNLELDQYALAATLDCMPFNSIHRKQLQTEADERTFCSGIMLINLNYWRENNAIQKLLDFSIKDRKPVFLHDQDSLNYVFKKKWFLLPPKWNKPSLSYLPAIDGVSYFDIYEYVYQPKVIHFSSDAKPWFNISFPYSKLYRFYLNKSGFSNPQYTKISWDKRLKFIFYNIKYNIRKYILPFIPTIVIILLLDIAKIFRLCFSLQKKQKMRDFILKESIKNFKLK